MGNMLSLKYYDIKDYSTCKMINEIALSKKDMNIFFGSNAHCTLKRPQDYLCIALTIFLLQSNTNNNDNQFDNRSYFL